MPITLNITYIPLYRPYVFHFRSKMKADFAIMYEDNNGQLKYGLVEYLNNHEILTVAELVPLGSICHITKFQSLK